MENLILVDEQFRNVDEDERNKYFIALWYLIQMSR